jgi:hypothetical protein
MTAVTTIERPMTLEEIRALVVCDESLEHALLRVSALDFGPLKNKLVKDGMTRETCEVVEDLYRRFLALNLRYPNMKLCPTGPIDDFWHAHILDTVAYEKDCLFLFGRILHHYPYFGMRGPEDRQELEDAFAVTVDLFIRSYGIDPTAGDTQARSCRPQNCP